MKVLFSHTHTRATQICWTSCKNNISAEIEIINQNKLTMNFTFFERNYSGHSHSRKYCALSQLHEHPASFSFVVIYFWSRDDHWNISRCKAGGMYGNLNSIWRGLQGQRRKLQIDRFLTAPTGKITLFLSKLFCCSILFRK